MKKLTTIIACVCLFFSASAFVPEADVTAKIRTVFEKEFISASDIKWTQKNDVYIASFKENDNYLTASYDKEGALLSVARYVETGSLPLKVLRKLKNRYASYTIDPTAIELSSEDTSYYIYAENEKCKLKIKSDASGNLNIESKIKK